MRDLTRCLSRPAITAPLLFDQSSVPLRAALTAWERCVCRCAPEEVDWKPVQHEFRSQLRKLFHELNKWLLSGFYFWNQNPVQDLWSTILSHLGRLKGKETRFCSGPILSNALYKVLNIFLLWKACCEPKIRTFLNIIYSADLFRRVCKCPHELF